jgi:hypothetical protein
MALQSTQDLNKKIASIGRAGERLRKDIQSVAVQAIGYSIEHGDVTIGQRLYDALGTSMRRQALVTFFEKNGQFCWSSVEKKFVFFKVEGIKFDEKMLMATPWNEAKKETIVSELDVADLVARLIKKVEAGIEKKLDVKHSALIDDIKIAYSQYLQEDSAANDAEDDEPLVRAA